MIPGTKEYPKGKMGDGDIDSGPLLFGFSVSATVITIGAMKSHGDISLASAIDQAVEGLGLHLTWRGKKFYALGLLPVGDLFYLWSKLAPVAKQQYSSPNLSIWWRFPFHMLSFSFLFFFGFLYGGNICFENLKNHKDVSWILRN